jgi:broad specificity phosphatase PhoE
MSDSDPKETLQEFREYFAGVYEIPYSIEMKDDSPFVFAGLWEGRHCTDRSRSLSDAWLRFRKNPDQHRRTIAETDEGAQDRYFRWDPTAAYC